MFKLKIESEAENNEEMIYMIKQVIAQLENDCYCGQVFAGDGNSFWWKKEKVEDDE